MGRSRTRMRDPKSLTTPSSPSHSSSSSDFEFTISISPRKSTTTFCPADELFYKGQLLPLHLSQRLSMVRTLLASSSTSSSSDTTTTASRDSTGSTSSSSTSNDILWLPECDSSRPSSVTEDDELRRLNTTSITTSVNISQAQTKKGANKYFSLSRFFKKDGKQRECDNGTSSVKRVSDVFRKYIKKVKPFYEKLSQKQQQHDQEEKVVSACVSTTLKSALSLPMMNTDELKQVKEVRNNSNKERFSSSFSGNLRYPRRKRSIVSSCPSSMRSSPSHAAAMGRRSGGMACTTSTSSMDELQSAIQGAIAHCKKSMNSSNEI